MTIWPAEIELTDWAENHPDQEVRDQWRTFLCFGERTEGHTVALQHLTDRWWFETDPRRNWLTTPSMRHPRSH